MRSLTACRYRNHGLNELFGTTRFFCILLIKKQNQVPKKVGTLSWRVGGGFPKVLYCPVCRVETLWDEKSNENSCCIFPLEWLGVRRERSVFFIRRGRGGVFCFAIFFFSGRYFGSNQKQSGFLWQLCFRLPFDFRLQCFSTSSFTHYGT